MILIVDAGKLGPRFGPQPGAGILAHLGRHGVAARVKAVESGGAAIVGLILMQAAAGESRPSGHGRLRPLAPARDDPGWRHPSHAGAHEPAGALRALKQPNWNAAPAFRALLEFSFLAEGTVLLLQARGSSPLGELFSPAFGWQLRLPGQRSLRGWPVPPMMVSEVPALECQLRGSCDPKIIAAAVPTRSPSPRPGKSCSPPNAAELVAIVSGGRPGNLLVRPAELGALPTSGGE